MRGRRGNRGRKSGPTTVSIDVQSLSVGTYAANYFSGWVSPSTTVSDQTIFSTTSRFISNSDTTYFIARTRGVSRDQEITTWMKGSVYLRCSAGGRAIVFHYNPLGDSYHLIIVNGVTEGTSSGRVFETGPGTSGTLHTFTLPDIFSIPGYSSSVTTGHEWTIGVEGIEIYLKYNGTEFFRTYSLHCLEPGYIGFAGDVFRDTSVTHKAYVSGLYSNLQEKFFDLRDYGMKTLSAVGSMTGGSTTLTLVSNPGFAIGDRVCIATGGEAGGGVPGERGVGGQWPTLTYANATARDADTSQVTNKVCGLLDTGYTYQWNGSAWVAYAGNLASYLDKILPKALVATITNVSGTTITLDTAATVSTTSANVYFDNGAIFDEWLSDSTVSGAKFQPDCTFYLKTGTWVFANTRQLVFGTIDGVTILGDGKTSSIILSPTGMVETGVYVLQSTGPRVAHLGFTGNTRTDKGYMFEYAATDQYSESGRFVLLEQCTDGLIEHIRGFNYSRAVSEFSACTNSTQRFIDVVHETAHKQYFQWAVQIAGSENCSSEDVDFDSPYLIKGVEAFGSTSCAIRRVTGVNVIFASNASSDLTIEDCDVVYETGAAEDASWNTGLAPASMYPSSGEPLVNLNTNIGGSSSGITINNCNFEVQGTLWGSGGGVGVIGINGSVDNVTVSGQYPDKPVTEPSGKFTLPDLGSDVVRAVRCDSSSLTLVVDGIRVNGAYTGTPVGSFGGSVQTNTTVRNCVLDNLGAGGTQTGNITNAEYEAL